MKLITFSIFFSSICIILISGCVDLRCTQQQYYYNSSLNKISIGDSKDMILEKFPRGETTGEFCKKLGATPMIIKVAKKYEGKLIEMGELVLSDGSSTKAHWFLFEDGILIQMGQPADWHSAAKRYKISYIYK